MQAAVLSFRFGWQWILDGAAILRKQPLAMVFWSLVTNLLFIFSYLIPLLGQALLIAAMPALTFLVLVATRTIQEGQLMRPGMWLLPLREQALRRSFTRLGLAYLAACLLGGLLATLPFLSKIAQALDTPEALDELALLAALQWPLVAFGLVYIVISALFWHAPALVGWHRLAVGQALFYSMVACWRNKWAFLVYAVSWVGMFYAVHQAGLFLAAMGLGSSVLQLLSTVVNLLLTALLYCTFYPIYKTTFANTQQAAS